MPTRAAVKRETELLEGALISSLSSAKANTHNALSKPSNNYQIKSPKVKSETKRQSTKSEEPTLSDIPAFEQEYHGLGPPKGVKREGAKHKIEFDDSEDTPPKKNRSKKLYDVSQKNMQREDSSPQAKPKTKNSLVDKGASIKRPGTRKSKSYGLTPEVSPFPDFVMPTPEACHEVNDLLSKLHGKVERPKVIPPPSTQRAGCGNVPDILDALLRTRLSANTSDTNSSRAIQGLIKEFGTRKSGPRKGSIDWEAVLEAKTTTIENAIRSGGLAKVKSEDIKEILTIVRDTNLDRRETLLDEKHAGKPAHVVGAEHETKRAKDLELDVANENLLSMDYLLELTTDEAMMEMMKLPGIGVKTAACVLLFRMKRPSFAVDTHVWRHCKNLGWVPLNATRDQTFSHCEVRIPDDLKHSLHVLFVMHGKKCGRCAASGSLDKFASTVCPVEHLVNRVPRKGGSPLKKSARKRKDVDSDDDDEEDDNTNFENLSV